MTWLVATHAAALALGAAATWGLLRARYARRLAAESRAHERRVRDALKRSLRLFEED